MSVLGFARKHISPSNPLLLLYHRLIAVMAAVYYGFPGNRMKVIAITGTKGKSTTAHLLASILKSAGYKIGLATSIGFQVGEKVWANDTKQTTQGRFKLQKLIRQMADDHCDVAILEVTSHALVQSRLWGVNFDIGVLTNIQSDHLEYHGGAENYLHAKGLLFASLVRLERKGGFEKTAILPIEDANYAYFDSFAVDKKTTYGLTKGTVTAADVSLTPSGSQFVLHVPNGEVPIKMQIPGEFNIHNALAASTAALALGIKLPAIQKGLEQDIEIPGRLEVISVGQPFTVIVDYAHTTESLEKVLSLFKPLTKGKLWLVFGATGGGRDAGKRPKMGEVADRFADNIILTDDDPYTEDRMKIINEIAAGIKRKEGERLWKIRDRKEAIRLPLTLAQPGDTVIIAGKGCEPIQIIGTKRIEWDDRKIAREILGSDLHVALN
ncbi:UDP-N-acetylmuramoyl-L-alanyl-D-glutamate--2,6-diaminopimelate ligase, partial [Candidatus Gracilibacteria bacterium]|nr:UDP-N-acetylmuramoyl-L-alanyl-D-glutamate--2,6-diaminopimelate ligase [Candidatus Gracilibacteria bacterium]